eukprot:3520671-Amphidinium_carterae.1
MLPPKRSAAPRSLLIAYVIGKGSANKVNNRWTGGRNNCDKDRRFVQSFSRRLRIAFVCIAAIENAAQLYLQVEC